jgi:hypothetical protein
MIGIYLGGSSKYGCIISTARGTWNFVRHLATLAQGSASEAHMNMDVNLCRLPGKRKGFTKFLVPLAVLMWHSHSRNCTDIRTEKIIVFFIIAEE